MNLAPSNIFAPWHQRLWIPFINCWLLKDKLWTMTSDPDFYRSQVSDLTLLIARMQKNADTVEKNVLRAEDLLVVVSLHLSLSLSLSLRYHCGWVQNGSRRSEQSKSQCCFTKTILNCHFCLVMSFRMRKTTRKTSPLNTRVRIPSASPRPKGSSRISSWIWTKPRKWNTHRQERSRKSEYTNTNW